LDEQKGKLRENCPKPFQKERILNYAHVIERGEAFGPTFTPRQ